MSFKRILACAAGSVALFLPPQANAGSALNPDDPNAPVPRPHYHSVLSGYEFRPVGGKPANWRELNDRMERIGGPLGQLRDPSEPVGKKKN